jgi:hypothetical protein
MATTPWLTSDDLITSIERRISAPISQNLFSKSDYLAFCNEEMMIGLVPSILQFNQEYFATTQDQTLLPYTSKYPIPERAIGQKFREVFYKDPNGNLLEMTRIDSSNRAYFNNSGANVSNISQYYIEGNNVVLVPSPQASPTGSLMFVYFLRPNQLVTNDRAAICTGFQRTITLNNADINPSESVTVGDNTFTVSVDFIIGVDSAATASNLNTVMVAAGLSSEVNSNVVTVSYNVLSTSITSTSAGMVVQTTQGVAFDTVPENITNSSYVDFLQTKSGHKTKAMDILIPTNGIAANVINFTAADVPTDFIIGDYVCLANECIIPQTPTDLHTSLAERASARVLSAIGDQQGLTAANEKLKEIEVRQGNLLDNRASADPTKILARKSLLRYGKSGRWYGR